MRACELDYELPAASIAQRPAEPRDAARLLVALGTTIEHATMSDLAGVLGPGDLLVVNDTKVLPARLHLRKSSGGAVEALLLAPVAADRRTWEALVRPGRRVPPGTTLLDDAGRPVLVVGERGADDGRRIVFLAGEEDVEAMLGRLGSLPLPPYIHEHLGDADRYQTVYAREPGSVAAPTAGLHFTDSLIARCCDAGAQVASVTLDVGLGTFQPMAADAVEDHRMHSERYSVPEQTLTACEQAERVIAVGTTALRALESAAATGEYSGSTDLFIHGQYEFRVVDVLLTNFHLPRSSLLALLSAFAGDRWRELYDLALDAGYRFLSFGDAMIVDRA